MISKDRIRHSEKIAVFFTSICLLAILFFAGGTLVVILWNGLGIYWQKPLTYIQTTDGSKYLGTIFKEDKNLNDEERIQLKIGNKDLYGYDYRWFDKKEITALQLPVAAIMLERESFGDFYGFLSPNYTEDNPEKVSIILQQWAESKHLKQQQQVLVDKINDINRQIYALNQQEKARSYEDKSLTNPDRVIDQNNKNKLQAELSVIEQQKEILDKQQAVYKLNIFSVDGQEVTIDYENIVDLLQPNKMGLIAKITTYIKRIWILISTEPREANTEGGIFPAIFGTISLIIIMSILSFPLGVIAAIYLHEYAKDDWLLKTVRIAVNNLAGVPSIVFGIFGLSFLIYGVGGLIDMVFYKEQLPNPTFGTGNILWASLTLGLLTAPVVIVSTEEALAAIPKGVREASLALGATKFQTVRRVVLPLAVPGMLTGFILAMARAAGEVAPLMITGVVKLAPSLPIDGTFPYIHLDRKFMHIGFHIFDVGFQSPNVEASKGMVYMSTLLLLLIVVILTSSAMYLRNKVMVKGSTF